MKAGRKSTHGHKLRSEKPSKEYTAWSHMRDRCNNSKHPRFADYGGRGIDCCDRWSNFATFLFDMGEAPSVKHSLERVDNNKGYSPENCTWATKSAQQINKRINMLTIDGETKLKSAWLKQFGISKSCFNKRIAKGWTIQDALRTPPDRHVRRKQPMPQGTEAGIQNPLPTEGKGE